MTTRSDATLAVGLAGLSVTLSGVMALTSRTGGNDPFDSPLYWWSWAILPLVAGAAGWARPSRSSFVWATALIAPPMLLVALFGGVLHDESDGASFWMASEVVLFVQGLITLAGAGVGWALATSTGSPRVRSR